MATADGAPDRSALMARHVEARKRRDGAALEDDAFRAACEEIATIEIAIARMEEPPIAVTAAALGATEKT
jgi:hypothetical protein